MRVGYWKKHKEMMSGGIPEPRHHGWFPLLNLSSTSHLLTTAASFHLSHSLHRRFLRPRLSLLLRHSLQGVFNRNGCIQNPYTLVQWSNDAMSACFSCLCLFDGNSPRSEGKNEGRLPQKMSRNRAHLRGHWTHVLLATNVILYVLQVATQGKLMLMGAKINSLIDKGQLWRLVTSSFLHANVGHLLVNCYSLNSVGPTVENICGTRRFFAVYFASAVASAAMSYFLCKAPAVGASGAIFGLVGSIAVFSMRHRSLLGSDTQDLAHIAQVIALNMVVGLLSRGIDNWGHLGGLLGGAAVSWFVGPAWTYQSTTRDGHKIFVDRAPLFALSWKRPHRLN